VQCSSAVSSVPPPSRACQFPPIPAPHLPIPPLHQRAAESIKIPNTWQCLGRYLSTARQPHRIAVPSRVCFSTVSTAQFNACAICPRQHAPGPTTKPPSRDKSNNSEFRECDAAARKPPPSVPSPPASHGSPSPSPELPAARRPLPVEGCIMHLRSTRRDPRYCGGILCQVRTRR
jgi:hypothetical protein